MINHNCLIRALLCLRLIIVHVNAKKMSCFFFSDNTYVSNSENNDDVLVTRDPIPVIFHRISTGKAFRIFWKWIPHALRSSCDEFKSFFSMLNETNAYRSWMREMCSRMRFHLNSHKLLGIWKWWSFSCVWTNPFILHQQGWFQFLLFSMSIWLSVKLRTRQWFRIQLLIPELIGCWFIKEFTCILFLSAHVF